VVCHRLRPRSWVRLSLLSVSGAPTEAIAYEAGASAASTLVRVRTTSLPGRPLALRIRHHVLSRLFARLVRPSSDEPVTALGDGYGTWDVPLGRLPDEAICYCAGVGEDTQFDEALMALGHRVYAFDPTPRAIAHAAQVVADHPEYTFLPVGVWSADDTLRFYAPSNPAHVSHSALNLQHTDAYFEAEVMSLPSLMERLGHDRVDLVKLDIEGAEHEVIPHLISSGITPRVVCLEFDQPMPLRRCLRLVGQLRQAGFVPVKVRGWNVTFVHTGTDDPSTG
jgi:FkbM family methyltransferase